MAYVQRPCVCGGTQFHVLPDVPVGYWPGWTGPNQQSIWSLSAVVCTACGRTELFTSNAEQVASMIKGARMINAGES